MDQSSEAMDTPARGWKGLPRRTRLLATLFVTAIIALSILAVPVFGHTRDARYEVINFQPELWVERDGRYAAWINVSYRDGFWCSYYDFARVTVEEREGMEGGYYTVTFHYSTGVTTSSSFLLGANEVVIVTSEELCASRPGENTITYSLSASPPRVYEKNKAIYSGHERWELKGNLTLRELEGVGGEYVITFWVEPQVGSAHVRGMVSASSIGEFNATIQIPSGECCWLAFSINAPKIDEQVSLLALMTG